MTNLTTILLAAIIAVESSGNDKAVDPAGRSWGALQETSIYIQDVNRIYGTNFSPADAFNRNLAIGICRLYMLHYARPSRLGRPVTAQDIARIHHGGPNGWKDPKTLEYWRKVKRELTIPGKAK